MNSYWIEEYTKAHVIKLPDGKERWSLVSEMETQAWERRSIRHIYMYVYA